MVHTKPMRAQRFLLRGLVVVALAACSPAAPARPDGWRPAVCLATDRLHAAHGQLASALAAMTSAEAELLTVAAAGLEREAHAAAAALEDAPAWNPGSQLIAELGAAADAFARAADAFRVGARQGDGPALDRAVATAQDADAALRRAELEAERLENDQASQSC